VLPSSIACDLDDQSPRLAQLLQAILIGDVVNAVFVVEFFLFGKKVDHRVNSRVEQGAEALVEEGFIAAAGKFAGEQGTGDDPVGT
jgi:hypothetical protein